MQCRDGMHCTLASRPGLALATVKADQCTYQRRQQREHRRSQQSWHLWDDQPFRMTYTPAWGTH
eukprot:scaffold444239_cov19-Prasinocladus_malaysianus.AAC.1